MIVQLIATVPTPAGEWMAVFATHDDPNSQIGGYDFRPIIAWALVQEVGIDIVEDPATGGGKNVERARTRVAAIVSHGDAGESLQLADELDGFLGIKAPAELPQVWAGRADARRGRGDRALARLPGARRPRAGW